MRRRDLELWQSADYRWRELFEAADVMSEGATRDEPGGRVYYGSTSVLLLVVSRGGLLPDAELAVVTRLLASDPHARLRAVRIACLEAQLQSGGPIGRVRAELVVRPDKRGARTRRRSRSAGLRAPPRKSAASTGRALAERRTAQTLVMIEARPRACTRRRKIQLARTECGRTRASRVFSPPTDRTDHRGPTIPDGVKHARRATNFAVSGKSLDSRGVAEETKSGPGT